jgi:hypothetical protein
MSRLIIVVWLLCLSITIGCSRKPASQTTTTGQSPSPAVESYPNLMARANELDDALGRKDYAKVVDLTYPNLVDYSGGREKLLAGMTREMKTMESEGVELLSSTSSAPTQFFHDATGIYAVVPVTSKVKAKDGIFQTEGSLIGISTDSGTNWTFVDATGKDQTELRKLFPNLDKLKLPAEKPPVKISN